MTSKAPYIHKHDGTVFKPESGKLYTFSKYSVNVLKAWPRPMAWKKTTKQHQHWTRFRPSLSWLSITLDFERRRHEDIQNEDLYPTISSKLSPGDIAWIQWYETIPDDVRTVIMPFRKRKWHLLSMIASCGKPAEDLIKSNPALAFALASNWIFHKPAVTQPMRSIRALLQPDKKQTDILKWLGFPATESARKILMKLPAEEISISNLFTLREAVKTPHLYKMLSHLPRLNNYLLYMFSTQTRFLVTHNLLQEFSALCDKNKETKSSSVLSRHLYLLKDTATMYRQLFPVTHNRIHIQSLAQLSRHHDKLCKGIKIELFKNLTFPQPPFKGTDYIIPLQTPEALYEEGKIQHNCVVSYSEQVALMRNIYIYRMLKPERCTIEIMRSSSRWTLVQLKASCNQNSSAEAKQAAEQWLDESQKNFF